MSNLYHTPISLVTYPNVENPENQANQYGVFFTKKRAESDALKLSLQLGLPMDLINTPMSRVTYPNVENLENQADQFWAFWVKMPKIDPRR